MTLPPRPWRIVSWKQVLIVYLFSSRVGFCTKAGSLTSCFNFLPLWTCKEILTLISSLIFLQAWFCLRKWLMRMVKRKWSELFVPPLMVILILNSPDWRNSRTFDYFDCQRSHLPRDMSIGNIYTQFYLKICWCDHNSDKTLITESSQIWENVNIDFHMWEHL